MRAIKFVLMLLLILLAILLGLIALGTFASLTDGAPLWLRSLGSLEGALGVRVGTFGLPPFVRAVILAVLASFVMALAAYCKPR